MKYIKVCTVTLSNGSTVSGTQVVTENADGTLTYGKCTASIIKPKPVDPKSTPM